MKKLIAFLVSLFVAVSCTGVTSVEEKKEIIAELTSGFQEKFENSDFDFLIPAGTEITNFKIDDSRKSITIETNKRFSYRAFREMDIPGIKHAVKNYFSPYFDEYKFEIYSLGFPIKELVPNLYRVILNPDKSRIPKHDKRPVQVVRNISKPYITTSGLNNKNIALWHSHGWYYNHKLDRWLWQRARLFQVVEDIGPLGFTIPYLVPMMENAGANVYLPRERDIQTNEVVVDNDLNTVSYKEKFIGTEYEWITGKENAFDYGNPPYEANYNPFEHGTHRITKASVNATAEVEFIPDIPEDGEYAVYISYKASDENVSDAHYIVYHLGGKTEYEVNQQIGGSTWIYLGTFEFEKGINSDEGKVVLDNRSNEKGKIVSADAVRFGGGMGNVIRGGRTSGRPKYTEAARYWMQYAGMPDTLVYNINNNKDDYRDDYQSRGEWVNYLAGAPFGPNKDREVEGLGIPIDLSLAFHTDAGITRNDTTVGTLSIYSLTDVDSNFVFPDGVSRLANRDLADILQTQIVEDLRIKYDPVWNRRYLWDGMYSEAARPNVPSVLLELLSHQNYLDCKFQLDPRYRFDVSRSIYKAFLKYLAFNFNYKYVVQPLPVTHFSAVFNSDGNIELKWKSQSDPLEPTAEAEQYVVYKRIGDAGFDNGTLVKGTTYILSDFEVGVIYSFKIAAVNKGGESFPSEILSICKNQNNSEPVLIVNSFDRVAPPASIETEDFTGFMDFVDQGVPDKIDYSYVGSQHNFTPSSKWISDDIPGHGASYADYETIPVAGNTFDFPFIHGSAIAQNEYSFVSVSDEALTDGIINLADYELVDLILGEEKETHWPKVYSDSLLGTQFKAFPEKMQLVLKEYLNDKGKLFVSGSYVGSDLFLHKPKEHPDRTFAADYLKLKLDADHAVRVGKVYSIKNEFIPSGFSIEFNTELNDSLYAAEAPDAIGSIKGSETLLRYSENGFSAATGYKGDYDVVAFGFPFETIKSKKQQAIVMKAVIDYLTK